jgi:hypothetical protein
MAAAVAAAMAGPCHPGERASAERRVGKYSSRCRPSGWVLWRACVASVCVFAALASSMVVSRLWLLVLKLGFVCFAQQPAVCLVYTQKLTPGRVHCLH